MGFEPKIVWFQKCTLKKMHLRTTLMRSWTILPRASVWQAWV